MQLSTTVSLGVKWMTRESIECAGSLTLVHADGPRYGVFCFMVYCGFQACVSLLYLL